ncbi:hypothetical protein AB0D32_23065 [Micromonospora sp. NPDC048170]|uniref:hypothetical protein n=1 Tax=Micromonospora sp. NPDC048170 TaxID=3154819 RepID=UPI0033D3844C
MTPDPRPATDDDRQPVILINKQGLTLGLDPTGAWIIWGPTNAVRPAQERLLWLLPLLERPPHEVTTAVTNTEADESIIPALLRFALESWSSYWAGLALGWLEAGVPTTNLINTLADLKDSPTQPQPIQHRALQLWRTATTT